MKKIIFLATFSTVFFGHIFFSLAQDDNNNMKEVYKNLADSIQSSDWFQKGLRGLSHDVDFLLDSNAILEHEHVHKVFEDLDKALSKDIENLLKKKYHHAKEGSHDKNKFIAKIRYDYDKTSLYFSDLNIFYRRGLHDVITRNMGYINQAGYNILPDPIYHVIHDIFDKKVAHNLKVIRGEIAKHHKKHHENVKNLRLRSEINHRHVSFHWIELGEEGKEVAATTTAPGEDGVESNQSKKKKKDKKKRKKKDK